MTDAPAQSRRLYASPSDGQVVSPFRLEHDPMQRLLLINFENDPDEVYNGFEPQWFDDPVNGRGLLVIGWRLDGRIDVYHQHTLSLAHKNFDIVAKGVADMLERPMDGARFQIGRTGVDVAFAFEDKLGRPIDVVVKETNSRTPDPFAILAPMGSAAEKPPSLPLVFLYQFAFVRRSGTRVRIRIDSRDHRPDKLPVPVDWQRVYFMRYAADPFILTWNEQMDGPLEPLRADGDLAVAPNGLVHLIVWRDGHPEIGALRLEGGDHRLAITFDPPIPDLPHIRSGATVSGTFVIQPDAPAGRVSGRYHVTARDELTELTIRPEGGWEPAVDKWEARLMFRVISLFREWPQSYVWRARLREQNGQPWLTSRWERTTGPQGLNLGR